MGLPIEGINLLVLVTVFWSLAILSVILRIWSRTIKRQAFVFNDWAIFVALLFTSGLAVGNIVAVSIGGIGNHLPQTTFDEQLLSVQIYTVVWILQAFANTFVRLSFLDLLRRIFKAPALIRAAWVLTGLTVAYIVGCFITFFALCRPFALNWNPTIKDGQCGNQDLTFLLSSVFNLVLDVAIISLPLPVVWGLQMKTERKIAVTAVFGVGLVVCAMTILRIIAVVNFNTPTAKMDFTYTVFFDALWSSLEPSLGVVNACLPLLPPVLAKFGVMVSRSTRRTDPSTHELSSAKKSQKWRKINDSNHSYYPENMPLTDVNASQSSRKGGRQNPNNIEVRRDIEIRREMPRMANPR